MFIGISLALTQPRRPPGRAAITATADTTRITADADYVRADRTADLPSWPSYVARPETGPEAGDLYNGGTPVTSNAQLVTAVANADAGDTILIAAGTYSFYQPTARTLDPPLTLKAADASNPPVFAGAYASNGGRAFRILNWTGLCLDGLTIQVTDAPDAGESYRTILNITTSTNITIRNCAFVGTVGGDSIRRGYGIDVSSSSGVVIYKNTMEDLAFGVAARASSDLTVVGNDVGDHGGDCFNFNGIDGLTFDLNVGFDPRVYAVTEHGDFCQIFTASASQPTSDAVLWNNFAASDPSQPVITYSNGSDVSVGRMQGIFIRNEKTPLNLALGTKTALIADNQMWGCMTNSLYASDNGHEDFTIRGNAVYQIDGDVSEDAIIASMSMSGATDITGSCVGTNVAYNLGSAPAGLTNFPTQVPNPNDTYKKVAADRDAALAVWRAERAVYLSLL